ncbi:hypothetical protein [Bosea sp. (in: a-proteobacteria)]|uniref:hypothetical protein n=1 Tax=Bosea sp. (in: a-proteobacteria) TaxID=1871050 RepID=UPI002735695E|nr:hypothetical protein [Bosea sp. (in: a-proteobacteria)]MDP3258661.1 hypothetical protein [Bosea sp. (in: a-proteobacteria)]
MARFTDTVRRITGVRDGDPVAPVFDAIDDLNARVVIAETDYQASRELHAKIRRETLKGVAAVGLVVAVATTAIALAAATALVRDLERRSAEQTKVLDDERSRSFDARVERRASDVAFTVVTEANARTAAAEAQLEVAREKLIGMVRNPDDNLRGLIKLSATATRDDISLLARLLRQTDPNIRRSCDALTTMSPAGVAKTLEFFIANKGRL